MRFDKAFPGKLLSLVFQAVVLLLFLGACGGDPTAPNRPLTLDAAIGTDPTTGATLETDQDDYFPGDSVRIVGTGWAAGEIVQLHLSRQPQTSPDNDWTVTADETGGFTTGFLVVDSDLGVTFKLTGSGPISGSVATVIFTDNVPVTGITLVPAPGTEVVAPGTSIDITVTGNVNNGGGLNTLGAIAVWAYLDGALPSTAIRLICFNVTPDVVHIGGGNTPFSQTFSFLAPDDGGVFHIFVRTHGDNTCTTAFIGERTLEDAIEVEASNEAPTAAITAPTETDEGSTIAVDGSGSSDNDGTVDGHQWSIVSFVTTGSGTCDFDGADNDVTASVTCTDNGMLTVRLIVTDNEGAESAPADAIITVNNVNPVADGLGTNTPVNEGNDITLSLINPSDASSVDEASLRYAFDCGSGYGAAVDYASASSTNSANCPTDDNGTRSVKGKVFDKDGGSSEKSATVTIENVEPTATFNYPTVDVNEGTSFNLSLTDFVEPSSQDLAAGLHFAFDCGDPATPVTLPTTYLAAGTVSSVSCPTADNATRTVKARIFDKDDGYTDYSGTVNVVNVPPSVTLTNPTIAGSLFNLLNGPILVSATYSDVPADTHQCEVELVGTKSAVVPYFVVSGGNCSNSISAPEAGVYTLIVRVKDDDGGVGTASLMIVVYDPSAGFVTGGGWIYSERGAYKADTYLEGKATFGFVSKYKKGASIPEGNTEFVFHAGGLNFHSTSYQFLLVNQAGTNSQFKGTGKINGLGSYTFMIWATDGGSGYPDTFRIQITDNNNGGAVVYDNGVEQTITGSIVIHTGGKK